MAYKQLGDFLQHLRRVTGPGHAGDLSDGSLLDRFASRRDEAAFEALVRRHGPMVHGVCRRVLRDGHDVEDAFQATFLVLVRKAASLARGELVGHWLYGVAYRTAVRARAHVARRRAVEQQAANGTAAGPADEADRRELRAALDEELHRLPEKYRRPLVLCYLEGKTYEDAARILGCPRGTVETRLKRARDKLRGRLTRRGLAPTAAVLAAALAPEELSAAVPEGLRQATVQNALLFAAGRATGAAAGPAALLAEGVLKTMFVTKLKVAAVVAALGVVASGAGLFGYQALAKGPAAAGRMAEKPKAEAVAPQDKTKTADPAKPADEKAPEAEASGKKNPKEIPDILFRQKIDFNGFDDPKATLQEVLSHLAERYGLTFDVNEAAFKAEQLEDVLAQPVVGQKPLPAMRQVTLATVLRKVLSRLVNESGTTFVVRSDVVEVTTQAALRAEVGLGKDQPMSALVSRVQFKEQPLREVLHELAQATGTNVLLDPRAGDKTKTPITAELANVPVDVAVRLLADMADLKAVPVANVLYVTTRENAGQWEEPKKK